MRDERTGKMETKDGFGSEEPVASRRGTSKAVAETIISKLKEEGANFLSCDGTYYLALKGRIAPIEKYSVQLDAMVRGLGFGVPSTETIRSLRTEALENDNKSTVGRFQVKKGESFYVSLFNDKGMVKISPDECLEVPNGIDDVWVLPRGNSTYVSPITYTPLDESGLKQALEMWWDLVGKNLPVSESEQRFLLAWLMSWPLYEYTSTHMLVWFCGPKGNGKTQATSLLSVPVYGEEQLGIKTVPALYEIASHNPLVVYDNVDSELRNPEYLQLLRGLGTGGSKHKMSSDFSGTERIRMQSLGIVNGIEPPMMEDIVGRTLMIVCDLVKYGSPGYCFDTIIEDIKKNRDVLLSAVYQISSPVLKRLKAGDHRKHAARLQAEYKDLLLTRQASHFGVVMLCLEEMYRVIGVGTDVWETAKEVLDLQSARSKEAIISNPILDILLTIRDHKSPVSLIPDEIRDFLTTCEESGGRVTIAGTAGQLRNFFQTYSRQMLKENFKMETSHGLATSLKSNALELKRLGFDIQKEKTRENQNRYTIVWSRPTPKAAEPGVTPDSTTDEIPF